MDNLRIGFACNGECSGGGWHGTGGNFVLTNDGPLWQRAVFIYAVFFLLLSAFMAIINLVWSCVSDEPDFEPSSDGYKTVGHVRRGRQGLGEKGIPISSKEKRQYRRIDDRDEEEAMTLGPQRTLFGGGNVSRGGGGGGTASGSPNKYFNN